MARPEPTDKGGRPLRYAHRLSERLVMLTTIDEREALTALAAEERMSMSELLRECVQAKYPKIFKSK